MRPKASDKARGFDLYACGNVGCGVVMFIVGPNCPGCREAGFFLRDTNFDRGRPGWLDAGRPDPNQGAEAL